MLTDLNDILLFAEVARERSFTRAARALGVPKSTVSRRIAHLEHALGERLVERTTRHVTLTSAGEAWAQHAQRVSAEVDAARIALEDLTREPRGALRVALPVDFAVHWLARPFASFMARYPGIVLDLDLAPREADLVAEHFDAAIRIGPLRSSSFTARRIATITRSLYASPSYVAALPVPRTPDGLHEHRLVALVSEADGRTRMEGARGQVELMPQVAARANNVGMQRALALAGAGLAVLPDVMCADDVKDGRLLRLYPRWQATPTFASLIMPSRRLVPAKLRLLIEHLDKELGSQR